MWNCLTPRQITVNTRQQNKGVDVVLIPDKSEEYLNDIEVEKLYHMFKGIGVKPYSGDSRDTLAILRYIE